MLNSNPCYSRNHEVTLSIRNKNIKLSQTQTQLNITYDNCIKKNSYIALVQKQVVKWYRWNVTHVPLK